jgi:uncharacterized membrane protein YqiK
MQLMQIIGDRQVRLIPDVLVNGNNGGNGLVDGLLTMLLWNQNGKPDHLTVPQVLSKPGTDAMNSTEPLPVIPAELLSNGENGQG